MYFITQPLNSLSQLDYNTTSSLLSFEYFLVTNLEICEPQLS